MSTTAKDASTEEIYAAPNPDALAQHIAAARIVASSGGGINPYEMVNAHNLVRAIRRPRDAQFFASSKAN